MEYQLTDSVKSFVKWLIKRISEWHLPKPKEADGDVKRLLIIRIDAIGDFVIFSGVLPYYRELYSKGKWHITLLANKSWLSLAERCPFIDEIIPFNNRKFTRDIYYRRNLIKQLRAKGFDTAIYPTYSRNSFGDDFIRLSGAKEKIGYDGDYRQTKPKQKLKNNKHYTRLIPATKGILHEVERNRDFVHALGSKIEAIPCPTLWIMEEDEELAKKILESNDINDGKPFAVFFPGASSPKRFWSIPNYAELANQLVKKYNVSIAVCGSSNEQLIFEKIQANTDVPLINLVGKTSLPILGALIRHSRIYIGSETSGVHIATAVGTPAICILGGGHFGRFLPYPNGIGDKTIAVYKEMDCFGCNWKCIHETILCIQDISVEEVYNKLSYILNLPRI